jgi:hypothetical protein
MSFAVTPSFPALNCPKMAQGRNLSLKDEPVMTRRKFIASLSVAAATVIVPRAQNAAAEPRTPKRVFPRHRMTVLDSTVIHGDAVPNTLLWPEPVPGAQRSLMMGSILAEPGAPPLRAQRILEVANACRDGMKFPNWAFGVGPHGQPNAYSYGPPSRRMDLVSLDIEFAGQATDAATMKSLVLPVTQAGHRLAVYAPSQLLPAGADDGPLKRADFTVEGYPSVVSVAEKYASDNKSWIDLLWGIGCGMYFGAEKNDETSLIFLRNFIRLAKHIYPGRRTIATLSAQRETSWGGVGCLPPSLCERIAKVVREERVTYAEVWGLRNEANLYLLKCLGARAPLTATATTRPDSGPSLAR